MLLPIPLALALLEKTGVTDFITTDKEEEQQEAMEDKVDAAKGLANLKTQHMKTADDMKNNMYKQEDPTGFFASDDYGKSTSDPNAKLKSVYRMKGNPMKRNFPKHIKK